MSDVPSTLTFGQRVMARACRVKGLRENQTAILEWLFSLGHEVDDEEFIDDLLEDQYVWFPKPI